jgi:hypothetical protein
MFDGIFNFANLGRDFEGCVFDQLFAHVSLLPVDAAPTACWLSQRAEGA